MLGKIAGSVAKKAVGKLGGGLLKGKKGGGSKAKEKLSQKSAQAKTPREIEQLKERLMQKLGQTGMLTPELQKLIQGLQVPDAR